MTAMLLIAALACLAGSTHRQAEWLRVPLRGRAGLRGAGAALLLLSVPLAGGGAALVDWFGLVTLCALLVVLGLWGAGEVARLIAARRALSWRHGGPGNRARRPRPLALRARG